MGVAAGKSYSKREPEIALPVEFKDGEAHAPRPPLPRATGGAFRFQLLA
jgi:hypothetical protein